MSLNELHQAILDGRTEMVRQIAATRPDLMATCTEIGTPTLVLSQQRGYPVGTFIALLRAGVPGAERPRDWAILLDDFMHELSQDCTCAAWLEDVEFLLWHLVATRTALPERLDMSGAFSSLSTEVLNDLEYLARHCGGWITFSDAEARTTFIPQQIWQRCYIKWRAEHGL